MDKVTVKTALLLEKLKTNRDKHREIFLEAQEEYRKQIVKELDQMLQEAREGRHFRRSVTLQEPVDYTADYNAAIAMLEMSIDAEIEISRQDFACFVMDDWQWKRNFLVTNSAYSTVASGCLTAFDS